MKSTKETLRNKPDGTMQNQHPQKTTNFTRENVSRGKHFKKVMKELLENSSDDYSDIEDGDQLIEKMAKGTKDQLKNYKGNLKFLNKETVGRMQKSALLNPEDTDSSSSSDSDSSIDLTDFTSGSDGASDDNDNVDDKKTKEKPNKNDTLKQFTSKKLDIDSKVKSKHPIDKLLQKEFSLKSEKKNMPNTGGVGKKKEERTKMNKTVDDKSDNDDSSPELSDEEFLEYLKDASGKELMEMFSKNIDIHSALKNSEKKKDVKRDKISGSKTLAEPLRHQLKKSMIVKEPAETSSNQTTMGSNINKVGVKVTGKDINIKPKMNTFSETAITTMGKEMKAAIAQKMDNTKSGLMNVAKEPKSMTSLKASSNIAKDDKLKKALKKGQLKNNNPKK